MIGIIEQLKDNPLAQQASEQADNATAARHGKLMRNKRRRELAEAAAHGDILKAEKGDDQVMGGWMSQGWSNQRNNL